MKFLALIAALALAACGSQKELRPAQGQALPPAQFGAEKARTPGELIDPDAQARPDRSDEVLTRSQDRADDRFDLPPQ